jgi:palmitoyltransferase
VIVPILSENVPLAAVASVMYFMLICFLVYYTILTTKIDPTDPTVYFEREAKQKGYDVVGFDPDKYEYFCNICKTHVLENTKHCQQCNRCVEMFDHHCHWLNNCIGLQNYKYFIRMLSFVTIAIIYQEVFSALTLRWLLNS